MRRTLKLNLENLTALESDDLDEVVGGAGVTGIHTGPLLQSCICYFTQPPNCT